MLTCDVTERFRSKVKDLEAHDKMKGNENTETEGRGLGLVDP